MSDDRLIVKMGSNHVNIRVVGDYLSSQDLIKLTLAKCKIVSSPETYALFLVITKGIERRMHSTENVKPDSSHRHRVKPEYVVRKLLTTDCLQHKTASRQTSSSSVESMLDRDSINGAVEFRTTCESKSALAKLKTACNRLRLPNRSRNLDSTVNSQRRLIAHHNLTSGGNSEDETSYDL